MYIYLDESSDSQNYVLAAVCSDSPQVFTNIVNSFRHTVRDSILSTIDKGKINNDPKERILYRDYPQFLVKYLDIITTEKTKKGRAPRANIYTSIAYYEKKDVEMATFPENRMLKIYEALFLEVIRNSKDNLLETHFDIIFDHFMKAKEMKSRLNITIPQQFPNITFTLDYAEGGEKKQHLGLFVSDIIVGTCRRYIGKESRNYYPMIKRMVIGNIAKVTV